MGRATSALNIAQGGIEYGNNWVLIPYLTREEKEEALKMGNLSKDLISSYVMTMCMDDNQTPHDGTRLCLRLRCLEMYSWLAANGVTNEQPIPDQRYDNIPQWIQIVLDTKSIDTLLQATREVGALLRAEKNDKERVAQIIYDRLARWTLIADDSRKTNYDREQMMVIVATNYWSIYHKNGLVRNACMMTSSFSSSYYTALEYLFGELPPEITLKLREAQAAGVNVSIQHEYTITAREQEVIDRFASLASLAHNDPNGDPRHRIL